MGFEITFPKSVQIDNKRLTILFLALQVAAVAYVFWTFWASKRYLVSAKPQGSVFYWVLDWQNDEAAAEANDGDGSKDFCMQPTKYEYCSDPNCNTHWTNFGCRQLCTKDNPDNCLESNERWVKDAAGLFFPTYCNSTIVMDNEEKKGFMNEQYLMKGVERLSIGFDHDFQVSNEFGDEETGDSMSLSNKHYTKGLLTILVDDSEPPKETARWEPGMTVDLPMKDILDIGGVDLDDIWNVDKNHKKDAEFPDGILTRLAGVDVYIEISYYNPVLHRENWNGPVSYIKVRAVPRWGIRIRFLQTGRFGWMNINMALIDFLTSVLVFIGLAKTVVFKFALLFLGHLSTMYKHVCFQRISLQEECYGLAARLMTYGASYEQIRDRPGGISKDEMFKRFQHVFGGTAEIDDQEIRKFVEFVFHPMNHGLAKNELIAIDEWSDACTTNEDLQFASVIKIFDAHRKRGVLENLFVDDTMRSVFKAHKATLSVPPGPSHSSSVNGLGPADTTDGNGSWEHSGSNLSEEVESFSVDMGTKKVANGGSVHSSPEPAPHPSPGSVDKSTYVRSGTSSSDMRGVRETAEKLQAENETLKADIQSLRSREDETANLIAQLSERLRLLENPGSSKPAPTQFVPAMGLSPEALSPASEDRVPKEVPQTSPRLKPPATAKAGKQGPGEVHTKVDEDPNPDLLTPGRKRQPEKPDKNGTQDKGHRNDKCCGV